MSIKIKTINKSNNITGYHFTKLTSITINNMFNPLYAIFRTLHYFLKFIQIFKYFLKNTLYFNSFGNIMENGTVAPQENIIENGTFAPQEQLFHFS